MEARSIGRRGLPVVIAVAWLRFAALGCGDPEAFRLRGGVTGAGGQLGVGGAAGTSVVGGVAGDGLAGASGAVGLGGQGGAAGAGADTTGAGGIIAGTAGAGNAGTTGAGGAMAGQGGAGPDAGTDAPAGTAGAMGTDGGGAGTTGAAGTAGAAGGRGGAGGGGGNGGNGGSTGGAGAAGTGAVNYCDRTHWTAKASVTGGDGGGPPAGIDGDLTTRWANNHGQNGTDYYLVDFGGTVKLSKITLVDTLTYPDDYPGAYAVYGSSDGTTFDGTPFVTGAGTTGSTVITFTQRPVRAVRVNQTGNSRPNNWWQIGEFQVVCSL